VFWYGFCKFEVPSINQLSQVSQVSQPAHYFCEQGFFAMRISDKRLTSIDLIEIGWKLGIPIQVYSKNTVPDSRVGSCFIINLDEEGGGGPMGHAFSDFPSPPSFSISTITECPPLRNSAIKGFGKRRSKKPI
jgi:hypothetical protein